MDVYKRLQEIRSTAKGGPNFSFSKEECDKFWELYTNNLSIRKIAKAMNCTPGKIQAIERRLKLPKVIYFQSQKELILTFRFNTYIQFLYIFLKCKVLEFKNKFCVQ
jgi:hypothetical protein